MDTATISETHTPEINIIYLKYMLNNQLIFQNYF